MFRFLLLLCLSLLFVFLALVVPVVYLRTVMGDSWIRPLHTATYEVF